MGSLPSGSCEGGVHWAKAGTKQSCAVCRQGGRQIVKTLKLSKYEEEHHGDGKSLVIMSMILVLHNMVRQYNTVLGMSIATRST